MEYIYVDIEATPGVANYGCSYVLEIENERIQKNMEYENRVEFMRGHAKDRYSRAHVVGGEVIAEVTIGNPVWSYLAGSTLGGRTEISNYAFAESLNKTWGIKIGYLQSDVAVDSTNFTIVADSNEFDTVDAVIVNDEFIEIAAIGSNTVTECTRGSQGTTARLHSANDLVYGVSSAIGRSIVLAHRKKTGGFVTHDYTMSVFSNKSDDQYIYTGMCVREMTYNFRTFDIPISHMHFVGMDSTTGFDEISVSTTDDWVVPNIDDIKVCSMNESAYLRQLYIGLYSTLQPGGYKFLNSAPQKHFITRTGCYGTLTWRDESEQHVEWYEQDTKRNFSISMASGNNRLIFAVNNVRINTVSSYHDGSMLIQDSAPFYSYEDPVVLFQF